MTTSSGYANYAIEVWQPLGQAIASLPDATDRTLTVSVMDGDTFTFSLDGRSKEAKYVKALLTDVVVYRNGQKIFRGRVMSAEVTRDAVQHTIAVTCIDYKQLLTRRFIQIGDALSKISRTLTDLELVGWNCINVTQSRSATWNLGITRGKNQSTGVTGYKSFEAGTTVRDALDQIMASATSSVPSDTQLFDWWIDADLVYRVGRPTRGRQDPTYIADFGGSVISFSTQTDSNNFANFFEVQGKGAFFSTATCEDTGLASGAVYEDYVHDSNLNSFAETDAKAFFLAVQHGQIDWLRTYSVEISPSHWTGPNSLWVGDTLIMDLTAGGIDIITQNLRVLDMHVAIGDNGMESIGANIGRTPPLGSRNLNRLNRFFRSIRNQILATRTTHYQKVEKQLWATYHAAERKYGAKHAIAKAAAQQARQLTAQYANFRSNGEGF